MKGTKELIVKTARKLFGKRGITGTSMDDIATEAKIGKGTIYHYYESKEKLFIEVAETEVEILRETLTEALNSANGTEGKFRAYVSARFKLIEEMAKVFSLFKDEYIEYYSYIKKVQDKFYDFELVNLKKLLTDGNEQGIFNVQETEFVAFALSRWIHAMEYSFGVSDDRVDAEKKIDILLNFLINGLKKK